MASFKEPTPRERAILDLIKSDGPVAMDEIINELWPDPDRQPLCAYNTVTTLISYLRKKGFNIKRGYVLLEGGNAHETPS